MDPSIVETLLDAFGPFLFPVALFAAGVVGYGVLLLANRALAAEEPGEWSSETSGVSDDTTDADRHDG